MESKVILILITAVTIFLLEGVIPHYPDRTGRAAHVRPHVLTALLNALLSGLEFYRTDRINYTSILSFWDRLFGSFRMREDTRSITLGLKSFREEKWQGLWGFLITPFTKG